MSKFFADIPTKTIVKFWAVLVVFLGGIFILQKSVDAIVIVLVGFFLGIVLNRPVDFFEHKLGGRNRAVTLVLLIAVIILVASILVIVPYFFAQIYDFLLTVPSALQNLAKSNIVLDLFTKVGLASTYDSIISNLQSWVGSLIYAIPNSLANLFGGVTNMLVSSITVIMVTIFALVEGDVWLERYWRIVYKNDITRTTHQKIADKMYNAISGYVAGTVIIALIQAVVMAVSMLILSFIFPLPKEIFLPLAVIMFLASFIPMFGGLIALVVSVFLIMLYSGPAALVALIFLLVLQVFSGNVLTPLIFNRTVKISPLTILIAITFGGFLGGFVGVLVSIPLAACIQVAVQEYIHSKKYRGFI
ncbi:MAG: AI-2E family transporter [Bifidobacteriaceae bacterium]|jgi:predicted PurR-regulated permease PerM|nr:AI-2E family transporter [Bifidobacteriaceae bacterium]